MSTRQMRDVPARLEKLRRRFDRWRETHRVRSRLPDELWASAVRMAGTFGLNRTARALRLDYYVLKKRVEQDGVAIADPGDAPFLELVPPPSAGACECTLELEDAAGAKMRAHLKAAEPSHLAAISRSFWTREP